MTRIRIKTNFRHGEIYKVWQGQRTYDAVFLKEYSNHTFSFISSDCDLDSSRSFTVDGKTMLIARAKECSVPFWIKFWKKTTNKTAKKLKKISFKFPDEIKITKPVATEKSSQVIFKEGKIYKVKQGQRTYDALFSKEYKNDKFSFILGDNDLDSDLPFTVDGKPMLIVSASVSVSEKWMNLWNTTTNKTAEIHERIVFKFPAKTETH